MRSLLLIPIFLFSAINFCSAQSSQFFQPSVGAEQRLSANQERRIVPEKYLTFSCDLEGLKEYMRSDVISRFDSQNGKRLSLPLPDGSMEVFEFKHNPTMQSEIAARYPEINTFVGRGTKNPRLRAYMDYTYNGFHAVIYEGTKRYYIDPIATNQTEQYIVYDFKDYSLSPERNASFTCGLNQAIVDLDHHNSIQEEGPEEEETALEVRSNEIVTYRNYRLALATTGEYYAFQGGTPESVMSEVVTAINRVNSVLENEHAIHLTLINNTDLVFYSNASTDPYTNGDTGAMINENPTAIGYQINPNEYDIGHVFGTNAGGLAQLRSVCTGSKARGVTCHYNPVGDGFYVDYVCHEMGHQFGANHVMNQCNGNNESSGNAYEPGSGSTIMSYSGLCGSNNVIFDSGPYYNVHTLSEFKNFAFEGPGNVCPIKTVTTNHAPEAIIPWEGDFYIPISTPFELTGTGTDEDGDELYFNWEQHDLGPSSPLGDPSGNAPIFRSYDPQLSGTRIFPTAFRILTNQNSPVEVLPTYSRDLTFRFTARDFNEQGGGTDWTEVAFKATDTAGPFLVTSPNTNGITWHAGEYREVTWDVANTDNDLVNCQYVDLFLSTDNGYTFPDTIVTNVKNDGSYFITVPNNLTTKARIKVKAHDNKFFDISNAKFTIAAASEPGAILTFAPDYLYECLPGEGSVDFTVDEIGGYNETLNFTVSNGLPDGATYSFVPTSAMPGEQVTLNMDFSNVVNDGLQAIEIMTTTASLDTMYRTVMVELNRSDFSSIENTSPLNDAHNLALSQNYSWTAAADADTYDFQLSTHLSFNPNDIVLSAEHLTETQLDNFDLLSPNTVYYWRVRGVNDCGAGEWRDITAFKTIASECFVEDKTEDIFIPSGSANVKESKITITQNGTIEDLNIPIVRGLHSSVSDLRMDVISPSGTSVLLWKYKCGTSSNFNLGLDDEASLPISCPLSNQSLRIPQGSLSDFDGESSMGDWTLRITDSNISNGGTFKEWSIEFCQSLAGNAPELVTNETMYIHALDELYVGNYHLQATDLVSSPNQLTYTLVTAPQYGELSKFDYVLSPGQNFLQGTIDQFALKYKNTDASATEDSFRFEVRDHEGGWIGIYTFNIVIDDNAVYTNVSETKALKSLDIFPNPTVGDVTISIDGVVGQDILFEIFDMQGRLIQKNKVDNFQKSTVLGLDGMEEGAYIIQAKTNDFIASQKLILMQ